MQIFVKLHGGRTRSLSIDFPSVQVALLKEKLEDYEGIPIHEQRLVCSQRELSDDTILGGDDLFFLSLSLRIPGGKGGFGSLLRGAATRVGQKKTDNFDACRDLNGRRIRHQTNEKKIAEWIAQAKERELEKIGQAYVKKLENQHNFDEQKYTAEKEEITGSVSNAIEKGIDEAKKTLWSTKKRPLEEKETSGPLTKRNAWDMDDIPEYESEPEVKEKKRRTESPKHTSTTTTTTTTTSTTPDDIPEPEIISVIEETITSTTTTTTTTTITTATTITPTPEPAAAPVFVDINAPTINLSKYDSAEALLQGESADILKAELQRLGLLCGGTPLDRAARLYLLKTTPLDELDKKHFAKKNGNNNKRKR